MSPDTGKKTGPDLRLETLDGTTTFRPGDPIDGLAAWDLDKQRNVVVRFFWRTEGKGTQDIGLEDEVKFQDAAMTDAQPFHFTAPAGPYSFDGRLVAIVWTLEVQAGKHAERLDLTITPAS